MSSETFNLKGRKTKIHAPSQDGLAAVELRFPNVTLEGMPGHKSYYIHFGQPEEEIVAEAWMHRTQNAWWLRIKD
jgi:hypothetical protein